MVRLYNYGSRWQRLDYDKNKMTEVSIRDILESIEDYENIELKSSISEDELLRNIELCAFCGNTLFYGGREYFVIKEIKEPAIFTRLPYKCVVRGREFYIWIDGYAYCITLKNKYMKDFRVLHEGVVYDDKIKIARLKFSKRKMKFYHSFGDVTTARLDFDKEFYKPMDVNTFLRKIVLE